MLRPGTTTLLPAMKPSTPSRATRSTVRISRREIRPTGLAVTNSSTTSTRAQPALSDEALTITPPSEDE